jgi:probable rRNA maturation factor
MMPVIIHPEIIFETPQWGKSGLSLKKNIPITLNTAWSHIPHKPKIKTAEVTITLTDDTHIQKLNSQFRKKNKPTNVLSFPMFDTLDDIPVGNHPIPLGEIFIAFETIKREAVEQDKSVHDHLHHMVVHGFLHLLGYDHMVDDEAEEMENLEIKILKKMGISNPYLEGTT